MATIAGIARAVKVPLTADVEGGYSSDPAAVGINIEDGANTPDLLCAKIEAARRAGARAGVALFVNARTDVYLRGLASAERRVTETLARAERYRAAGADGIFVPGVVEAAEIRSITSGTRIPLNVMARPGLPAAPELESLGVRRLSSGGDLAEAAFGRVAALAAAFLRTGESEPLVEGAMPYPEINALMPGRR